MKFGINTKEIAEIRDRLFKVYVRDSYEQRYRYLDIYVKDNVLHMTVSYKGVIFDNYTRNISITEKSDIEASVLFSDFDAAISRAVINKCDNVDFKVTKNHVCITTDSGTEKIESVGYTQHPYYYDNTLENVVDISYNYYKRFKNVIRAIKKPSGPIVPHSWDNVMKIQLDNDVLSIVASDNVRYHRMRQFTKGKPFTMFMYPDLYKKSLQFFKGSHLITLQKSQHSIHQYTLRGNNCTMSIYRAQDINFPSGEKLDNFERRLTMRVHTGNMRSTLKSLKSHTNSKHAGVDMTFKDGYIVLKPYNRHYPMGYKSYVDNISMIVFADGCNTGETISYNLQNLINGFVANDNSVMVFINSANILEMHTPDISTYVSASN